MDRGAWWATVHRVAKSQTQLKQLSAACMPCNRDHQLSVSPSGLPFQLVKNLPAMPETPVRFLGWEDPLEKG